MHRFLILVVLASCGGAQQSSVAKEESKDKALVAPQDVAKPSVTTPTAIWIDKLDDAAELDAAELEEAIAQLERSRSSCTRRSSEACRLNESNSSPRHSFRADLGRAKFVQLLSRSPARGH